MSLQDFDENSLVDPFAQPSQESMAAMPIDPEHIDKPTETPGTLDDRTVLGYSETDVDPDDPLASMGLGIKWFDGLVNNTPLNYSAEELTPDITPEVSPSDMEKVIGDDLSHIAELENIAVQIGEQGGLNKALAVRAESIETGAITSRIPLNSISNFTTPGNVDVSLESLGSKIKEILLRIIRSIREGIKTKTNWVLGLFDDDAKDISPTILTDRRKELLEEASRLDSSWGSRAILKTLGKNDPLALKSASGRDYVIRLIDHEFIKSMQGSFTVGYKSIISDATYPKHVERIKLVIRSEAERLRQDANTLKGQSVDAWTIPNVNDMFRNIESIFSFAGVKPNWDNLTLTFDGYNQTVTTQLNRRIPTGHLKEFVFAATYTNPFGQEGGLVKSLQRDLAATDSILGELERKISNLDDKSQYATPTQALTALQKRMTMLTSLLTVYKTHRRRYASYFNNMELVLDRVGRKLKAVSVTARAGGIATN